MIALLKKEILSYFSSQIGFLTIGFFLLLSSLFLFVFETDFNILTYGFADLSPFFLLVPWLFIFLIPAITMRSFTIEENLGTLEMLFTRPLSYRKIVAGKGLSVFFLVILALLPTLLYVICIGLLGETSFNLDMGTVIGSYIGVLLIALIYTSVGVFCSTLTSNQIVAFISGALICLLLFYGFEGIATSVQSQQLHQIGIKYHYDSMARGVIDTRDVVYFLSMAFLFFALSEISLTLKYRKK